MLEVACFNLQSALIAQKAGAERIELCKDYKSGGISPGKNEIKTARKELNIDLFVMIRPRAGNFIYTIEEFELMKSQIHFCKEQNCDGVVFGILNRENKVDLIRCKELVELAKPMDCTFHRAFDEIANIENALEDVITCGFKRILTSGKSKTALDGSGTIKGLTELAKSRIIIMPGGSVRSSNIAELRQQTNVTEFHSAAITNATEIADPDEIQKLLSHL